MYHNLTNFLLFDIQKAPCFCNYKQLYICTYVFAKLCGIFPWGEPAQSKGMHIYSCLKSLPICFHQERMSTWHHFEFSLSFTHTPNFLPCVKVSILLPQYLYRLSPSFDTYCYLPYLIQALGLLSSFFTALHISFLYFSDSFQNDLTKISVMVVCLFKRLVRHTRPFMIWSHSTLKIHLLTPKLALTLHPSQHQLLVLPYPRRSHLLLNLHCVEPLPHPSTLD